MIIFGAGMAGLLAAQMLRRFKPVVYEKQATLPNNHEALLRFRSNAVSIATGIPFTRVEVTKAVWYEGKLYSECSLEMNNKYSYKTTGEYSARSIGDLRTVERWIAPANFIEMLASGVDIRFNYAITQKSLVESGNKHSNPIISTLPMPVLANLTEEPPNSIAPASFKYRPIWALTADIVSPAVNLHQTIYYPGVSQKFYNSVTEKFGMTAERSFYRASINGSRVILEFGDFNYSELNGASFTKSFLSQALDDFGLKCTCHNIQIKEQKFGKIMPIDERERRAFILKMTDEQRIYSLGRFATWRPKILLDDLVQDVRRIEALIEDRGHYQMRLDNIGGAK